MRRRVEPGRRRVGSILIAERLWKNHHKGQAIAVMLATNGMMAAVSARNAGVIRQPQHSRRGNRF